MCVCGGGGTVSVRVCVGGVQLVCVCVWGGGGRVSVCVCGGGGG